MSCTDNGYAGVKRPDTRRRFRIRGFYGLIAGACLLLGFLACCVMERDWEPAGTVEIVQYREWDDGYSTVCTVTYRIINQGEVDIYATTVTIRVDTKIPEGEEESYFVTFRNDSRVPRGESITGTIDVEYCLPEEETSEGGVSIEDFFLQ